MPERGDKDGPFSSGRWRLRLSVAGESRASLTGRAPLHRDQGGGAPGMSRAVRQLLVAPGGGKGASKPEEIACKALKRGCLGL